MAISNPLQPTTVSDYSGGITDNYFTAPANCSSNLDNFWLDENGKPYSRPGITCFTTRLPSSASASASTISGIYVGTVPFTLPLFFVGPEAYYLSATNSYTLVDSIPSLVGKGNTDLESSKMWQQQLISVSASSATPGVVIPNRIWCDQLSPIRFHTVSLGLPLLPSTPNFVSAGGSGNNYVYAFHYYYSFTDFNGTLWVEQGPVLQFAFTNVGAPESHTVSISVIPALANTAYSNWNTTTATLIKIYRTQNNGGTLYHLGDVPNGTTTYSDTTSDTDISSNFTIYTQGGVQAWDPPPVGSKYVTVVNDFFWYATDFLVTQSNQGSPGACPVLFNQPTTQKIKGLASIIGFPILFCDQAIYRIEGTFDELGNGGFELREISQTAGLISNRAVISVTGGLVFPGNGGFYFTDGYQVIPISQELSPRYQLWANPNMTGAYDSIKNIVTWACSDSENSVNFPNNIFVHLHVNFGANNPRAVFTTSSSKTQLYPTALAYTVSQDADSRFASRLLLGTADSYFMYLDPLGYVDPNIDHYNFVSAWTSKAIIYRYESCGMNLGDEANRKYAVELTAEFQNYTDLAVQFITRRDDSGAWGTLSEIRSDGALIWGVSEATWGSTTDPLNHDWNSLPIIEGKRHFPSGTLRSSRRQVGFTNSLTSISKSDSQSVATVNATTKTVTLIDSSTKFPDSCEDYFISFDIDNYTAQYQIKSLLSSISLTVYDPYLTLNAASSKWQIKGYRKNEIARLLSYTVFVDMDGTTQAPSRGNSQYVNS